MLSLPFFLFTFLIFAAASCSDDDNTVEEYPNWQQRNATYWDSLYNATRQNIANGDTSWKIVRSYSLVDTLASLSATDYIIVHVLNEGTGSGCPLYTDSVQLRHSGWLLPSTSYPEGYEFDNTNSLNLPDESAGVVKAPVSSFVNGFITALLYMHIGDKWEVYIPWTLGYNTSTSVTSIPPYSVLRFNIQLVAYSRAGTKLPDFKAKKRLWITE